MRLIKIFWTELNWKRYCAENKDEGIRSNKNKMIHICCISRLLCSHLSYISETETEFSPLNINHSPHQNTIISHLFTHSHSSPRTFLFQFHLNMASSGLKMPICTISPLVKCLESCSWNCTNVGMVNKDHFWPLKSCSLITMEHIEGFRPEWCISRMIYSRDTPFWSENPWYPSSLTHLLKYLDIFYPACRCLGGRCGS